jgi:hypothetical protein
MTIEQEIDDILLYYSTGRINKVMDFLPSVQNEKLIALINIFYQKYQDDKEVDTSLEDLEDSIESLRDDLNDICFTIRALKK